MRIGIVRTDLGNGAYIADISSRNQYPYASAVRGQARTVRRPVDSELLSVIKANPLPVAVTGLNTSTAIDTRLATGLSVRASRGATFTTIPVSPTGSALKTDISAQLNSGFASAGLPLTASIVSPNQLRITTVAKGDGAYVEVNSQGSAGYSGSLSFVAGLVAGPAAAPNSGALLAALKSAVYSGAAFNVGATAVTAAGVTVNTGASANFGLLGSGAPQFVDRIANLVAPKLVEGGDVLLSFAQGAISQLRDPNFFYHGVTGAALYATKDDGSTPFTYPG